MKFENEKHQHLIAFLCAFFQKRMETVLNDPFILWYIVTENHTRVREPSILYGFLIVFKKLRKYVRDHDLIDQLYEMCVRYNDTVQRPRADYWYNQYCGFLPNGAKHGVCITTPRFAGDENKCYTEYTNGIVNGLSVEWDCYGNVRKVTRAELSKTLSKKSKIIYGIELDYAISRNLNTRTVESTLDNLHVHSYSETEHGSIIRSTRIYDIFNWQLIEEIHYDDKGLFTGTCLEWNTNGDLCAIRKYSQDNSAKDVMELIRHGKWYYFTENGDISEYKEYNNDKLLCNIKWNIFNKRYIDYARFHKGEQYIECGYSEQHLTRFHFENLKEEYTAYFDNNGEILNVKYNYNRNDLL